MTAKDLAGNVKQKRPSFTHYRPAFRFRLASLLGAILMVHSRVAISLSTKARPDTQSFIWKWFNLHVNDSTKTRFEKEAKGNSEMA